jgi:hypothetical protein
MSETATLARLTDTDLALADTADDVRGEPWSTAAGPG